MPTRWDLPSLTSVKAFEAAARNLNMSRAADELNVTHAAVSQQVRALERWLGVRLFTRQGKGIMLTPEGTRYAEQLSRSFEVMEQASREARRQSTTRPLEVNTTTSFASRWLVPRLGRFQMAAPEVELRISPSRQLVDFDRDPVDVAIRYGGGGWPGVISERFMAGRMVAVCHPDLLPAGTKGLTPAHLANLTLLHDADYSEWEQWVLENGWDIDVRQGLVFGMSTLVVEAALSGQGVALTVESLVRRDVEAGRLTALHDAGREYASGYYLVYREQDAARPNLAAFLAWMRAEAAREAGDDPVR
ncbi:transcriptional regulator GcvA [Minwuia thermotolerans]|uniref:Transcriptional regulator n=1 Tax=Minwuia thermotolerans TaxID=2056226 RepID=A0A2M9FX98_9PROT|nr:transcriptional regulator GcvA [Minwuia thermotolerans]PJK28080.1 transcriptional regulator [Minwuia thermotolerans]